MTKFLDRIQRYVNRPWYLPFICFLSFIDLFVLVIPTEGMIVTTGLIRPKRWLATASFVALASSCGALALAWCGASYGEPFVLWLLGENVLKSALWIRTNGWIQNYGFWGLAFIALSPLTQQPAILICALGHMAPLEIGTAVFLGRAPKYLLFSFLATKGPRWFKHRFGDESLDFSFTLKNLKTLFKRVSQNKPKT